MSCRENILSEEYGELVLDFADPSASPEENRFYCVNRINDRFAVAYAPQRELEDIMGQLYVNRVLPRVFGLMAQDFDPGSLANSGILQTQRPPLSLTGRGVVLAFIDTGIRYTQPEFLNATGNSRVLAIWDQTLQRGSAPDTSTAACIHGKILMWLCRQQTLIV